MMAGTSPMAVPSSSINVAEELRASAGSRRGGLPDFTIEAGRTQSHGLVAATKRAMVCFSRPSAPKQPVRFRPVASVLRPSKPYILWQRQLKSRHMRRASFAFNHYVPELLHSVGRRLSFRRPPSGPHAERSYTVGVEPPSMRNVVPVMKSFSGLARKQT